MNSSLKRFLPEAQAMLARYSVEELPTVDVIMATHRPSFIEKMIKHINSQTVKIANLVLSIENYSEEQIERLRSRITNATNIIVLPVRVDDAGKPVSSLGLRHQEMILECESEFIACWDDDDWYHPNYLHSQLAYLKHTEADFVAKRKPIAMDIMSGSLGWLFPDSTPARDNGAGGSMVMRASLFEEFEFADVASGYDSIFQDTLRRAGKRLLGTDPFNFIVTRNLPTGHTWTPKEKMDYQRNNIAFEDTLL